MLALCPMPLRSIALDGCYSVLANAANTGSATLNLNGIGAKLLKKFVAGISTTLEANDISARANHWRVLRRHRYANADRV